MDVFHARVHDKALSLAAKIDVEESSPGLAGRQTHSSNVQATSAKGFYLLNLTIPFLDHMIT